MRPMPEYNLNINFVKLVIKLEVVLYVNKTTYKILPININTSTLL